MYLDKLHANERCCIIGIEGQGGLRRRFLDLGLTPNTEVKVIKVAPLGDPMEISLRGFGLTLRREDAQKIRIKRLKDNETCEGCIHSDCSGKANL